MTNHVHVLILGTASPRHERTHHEVLWCPPSLYFPIKNTVGLLNRELVTRELSRKLIVRHRMYGHGRDEKGTKNHQKG